MYRVKACKKELWQKILVQNQQSLETSTVVGAAGAGNGQTGGGGGGQG